MDALFSILPRTLISLSLAGGKTSTPFSPTSSSSLPASLRTLALSQPLITHQEWYSHLSPHLQELELCFSDSDSEPLSVLPASLPHGLVQFKTFLNNRHTRMELLSLIDALPISLTVLEMNQMNSTITDAELSRLPPFLIRLRLPASELITRGCVCSLSKRLTRIDVGYSTLRPGQPHTVQIEPRTA